MSQVNRLKALSQEFIERFPSDQRGCFVLGATGETGKRIVHELIDSAAFSTIRIISRNPVPNEFLPEAPNGVKLEQVLIENFDSIDENSKVFNDCQFGFCALGTTKKKAGGKENFYKIDHDLTLKLVTMAKSAGCKYLALVSAAGASVGSSFFYSRTKGQLEEDVKALNFEALRIYRPAMIQVFREENRLMEEIGLVLAPVFDFVSGGRAAIKIDVLVDAIVKDALLHTGESEPSVILHDNKSIKNPR